tara:strand:- start:7083 stop:7217 length:135 start_codon:yes stop_codon:yes gene_type:complete
MASVVKGVGNKSLAPSVVNRRIICQEALVFVINVDLRKRLEDYL